MRIGYLLLAGFFLLAACGKKGPLVPPESFVPAPVGSLSVEQKGDLFYLSWVAPDKDEGGRPIRDLAGFRVYRRTVLPPDQDCEECPGAYALLRTVDLEYPGDVRLFGSRYVLVDRDLSEGTTYQYKVISFRKDGSESGPSNRVRRTRVSPPEAPNLAAVSTPTGVLLRWEVPMPARGKLLGTYVYRRRGDDVGTLVLLTPTPVGDGSYEDHRLERGVSYVYTVRAVAEVDGQVVEGRVSNEVRTRLAEPE